MSSSIYSSETYYNLIFSWGTSMSSDIGEFQIGSYKVIAKVFSDTPEWFVKRLAEEATRISDGESVVYCPGGFRIEFGLGGEYAVCYDAFELSRSGTMIRITEIGYYREKISP